MSQTHFSFTSLLLLPLSLPYPETLFPDLALSRCWMIWLRLLSINHTYSWLQLIEIPEILNTKGDVSRIEVILKYQ